MATRGRRIVTRPVSNDYQARRWQQPLTEEANSAVEHAWPSVDAAQPTEEGGPNARMGFNYQDEIAVSFLIEMLTDPSLIKVHLETHDDIILVRQIGDIRTAEYVQVKAGEEEKFWSVSDICQRKKTKVGTSIFEKSLDRDRHHEPSLFRLVTLRPMITVLKPLTYPRLSLGRQSVAPAVASLLQDIDARCPSFTSPKGNNSEFWVTNCFWDQKDSEEAVARDNLLRLVQLAHQQGRPILYEPADVLLFELRAKAKIAGGAKWLPDPLKKIITRDTMLAWWKDRLAEILDGASIPSGGKLAKKMAEAGISDEMTALAATLRRDYASEIRTPRYLDASDADFLQRRVRSEVATLRAKYLAGEIDLDPVQFHSLCVSRMDVLNAERDHTQQDRSAFLKGCLYDITDRCLLRFTRRTS